MPPKVQNVSDFIERIDRRVVQKPRHNGFTLCTPSGPGFGYARQNQSSDFKVYANRPFIDLEGRFEAQLSSGDKVCVYKFAQQDTQAMEYALRVLRSAYDSR